MRIAASVIVLAMFQCLQSGMESAVAKPILITITSGRPTPSPGLSSPTDKSGTADHHATATGASSNDTGSTPYIVPRYENGRLEQRVEADDRTCQWISAGTATITVAPQYGVATVGTPPCTVQADYPYCPGVTYPSCSVVYYTRIQHNNKSVRTDPAGAVDTFTYHWQTPDNYFNLNFNVDVASPVVRPKGETNVFESWNEGKGRWRVKLVPPDTDPSFDFTGEKIRETYVSDNDSCLGSGASKSNQTMAVGPAPGTFGDSVGYPACTVEYVRAIKATPCGYHIQQKMEISSPADGDVFTQYGGINNLTASVTGNLIDQNRGQHAIGSVTSQRVTPLSSPAAVSRGLVTERLNCLGNFPIGWLFLSQF